MCVCVCTCVHVFMCVQTMNLGSEQGGPVQVGVEGGPSMAQHSNGQLNYALCVCVCLCTCMLLCVFMCMRAGAVVCVCVCVCVMAIHCSWMEVLGTFSASQSTAMTRKSLVSATRPVYCRGVHQYSCPCTCSLYVCVCVCTVNAGVCPSHLSLFPCTVHCRSGSNGQQSQWTAFYHC